MTSTKTLEVGHGLFFEKKTGKKILGRIVRGDLQVPRLTRHLFMPRFVLMQHHPRLGPPFPGPFLGLGRLSRDQFFGGQVAVSGRFFHQVLIRGPCCGQVGPNIGQLPALGYPSAFIIHDAETVLRLGGPLIGGGLEFLEGRFVVPARIGGHSGFIVGPSRSGRPQDQNHRHNHDPKYPLHGFILSEIFLRTPFLF